MSPDVGFLQPEISMAISHSLLLFLSPGGLVAFAGDVLGAAHGHGTSAQQVYRYAHVSQGICHVPRAASYE